MLKRLALVALLAASSLRAQSLPQLPRATVAAGMNDSTLVMVADSARRTRAARALDFRAMLSLRAFDSLVTANLRLTSVVSGSATWANTQIFATGQRTDSATGAARAQILTTARTIGGVSFNGSANIIPDSATGSARSQTLTIARTLWGQSFNGSANITAAPTFSAGATVSSGQTLTLTGATIAGAPTWSALQTFATGQLVDSATGAARSQTLTTARTLWGQSFNGSANITAAPTFSAGATVSSGQTLTLTGATIAGAPTWSALQTFATGQRTDSSTGAARAQILTTARTIGGVSFNGSANIIPDTAVGATRAQTLTTARTIGGTSFNGSANIVPGLADSATGANRAQILTTSRTLWGQAFNGSANVTAAPTFTAGATVSSGQTLTLTGATVAGSPTWSSAQTFGVLTVSSCTGCGTVGGTLALDNGSAGAPSMAFSNSTNLGLYRFGADTLGFASGGVHSMMLLGGASAKLVGGAGNMTVQSGTGASRTMTLQTTTSGSVAKDVLTLGADTTATFLGQIVTARSQINGSNCVGADSVNMPIKAKGLRNTGVCFRGTSAGDTSIVFVAKNAGVTLGFFGSTARMDMGSFQLLGATGAASAPSYAFGNQATIGMYLANSDTLGFSTASTKRLLIADQSATGAGDVALCVKTTGVTGVITQGATCGTSSAKVKRDIMSIASPTSKLMALNPVRYAYIPEVYGGRVEYGLVADSAMAVDSTLVFRADRDQKLPNGQVIKKGDALNVNDRAVLALLIATVQQQQRQIDSLMRGQRRP